MMRKIVKVAFIVAAMLTAMMLTAMLTAMLTVRAEAQQSEQVTSPQKAAEVEGTDPKLWFRLQYEDERADLFTHWERVHPHRALRGAATPRVYKRNTQSVDEFTYELDGQRHTLSHYLEKANISGLMVLRAGEVRLEYYGKDLDARSRNHVWSATKSFTSTLVGWRSLKARSRAWMTPWRAMRLNSKVPPTGRLPSGTC